MNLSTPIDRSAGVSISAVLVRHKKSLLIACALIALAVISLSAFAGTPADTWAASSYTFIRNMATGNIVRGICIVGGLIGMMTAAATGKPILALTGVALAIFGFLSPTMVSAIFGTALLS